MSLVETTWEGAVGLRRYGARVLTFRPGSRDDAPALLALFDEAVAWLVARGQPGQWGSEPWSADEQKSAFIADLVSTGLTVAEEEGEVLGGIVVGEPMRYVEPADEPELYVRLLITSRRRAGERIGAQLLDLAKEEARARGLGLLRVDCYAAPGLVAWYESQGFEVVAPIHVGEWEGRLLAQRVDD
jgi:GNAT superfamily N-acetyltransferase